MDLSKIKLERKYLGGGHFNTYAIRDYSLTITNTKLKGIVIRMSIYTPKISEFEWGVREFEFWIEGNEKVQYKTQKELLKALELKGKR